MKIIVAVRCYNESKHIERFLHGYDFADAIVVSDGGSTDDSVSKLQANPKVILHHFDQQETVNGQTWNVDAPHMNFVLNKAKELEPDWLIFDDMDCVPTADLRNVARDVFREVSELHDYQVDAFRLYLWGETGNYFPYMNRNFHEDYRSLWAWQPKHLDIHADEKIRHGTLTGLAKEHIFKLIPPYCLLHRSWYPETIDAKIKRYNDIGLTMHDPRRFAGQMEPLPEWAHE